MQRIRIEDFVHEQIKVQEEINRTVIKSKSFEIFEKSPQVRALLTTLKRNHKKYLKAYGYNPDRVMNVPTDKEGNPVRFKNL